MLQPDAASAFVGQRVLLLFQTTHFDKAGETSDHRRVTAEVLAVDVAGEALLIAKNGLHLRFPTAMLHTPTARDADLAAVVRAAKAAAVGGQEVVRDFHNAYSPVRLRWLSKKEIVQLLST